MRLLSILLLLTSLACGAPAARAQLYDVRPGSADFKGRDRDALTVQIDGTAAWTRDYWQTWLKDTYNIKLKGTGVLGIGQKDVLEARQIPVSKESGKLLDLYSTVTAPSDTVAELSVFAALSSDTWLDQNKTPDDYADLRRVVQSFATAARVKAYQEQIATGEKVLRETEKEKDKLQREVTSLQTNTTSNLAKIEALQKQNETNRLKAQEDSVKLITNGQQYELRSRQLQRRRDRLNALDRK